MAIDLVLFKDFKVFIWLVAPNSRARKGGKEGEGVIEGGVWRNLSG